MLDAIAGGLTIGLFIVSIYLPIAVVRIVKRKFENK